MNQKEMQKIKITAKIILFAIYAVLLFYMLFVAEMFGRGGSTNAGINLTPFAEIRRYLTNISTLGFRNVALNVLGNIVIFMPMGYALPSLFTKGSRWPLNYVIICATFSITVEVLQFASGTGSADIDDVILNTLGGFLGYLVYALTHRRDTETEGEEGWHLEEDEEDLKPNDRNLP